MEHKLATDEIKEQAALYALDALSQIEARAFENHLADGCEVCQSEVSEFDGVVGVLGLGAPPASPPAHLRDLLTARIAKEPRNISLRERARPQTAPAVPVPLGRRSPWIAALPWAVAACVAIVAVASVLGLQRVVRSTNQELAQLRVDLIHVNELLVEARQSDAEHVQVISLLVRPGSEHIFLAGQPGVPPSRADVYLNRRDQKLLVAADMAPAPPGQVYQLWYLAPGPKSAGLVRTGLTGHGFTELTIPADLGTLGGAAITLEPEGGSEQPTMPIYVVGKPTL